MAAYWQIAAHSAYDMFYKYKYLIVNLVFPPGNFFLIALFPDRCLLVPFESLFSALGVRREKLTVLYHVSFKAVFVLFMHFISIQYISYLVMKRCLVLF